jgi:hypothetical protein
VSPAHFIGLQDFWAGNTDAKGLGLKKMQEQSAGVVKHG